MYCGKNRNKVQKDSNNGRELKIKIRQITRDEVLKTNNRKKNITRKKSNSGPKKGYHCEHMRAQIMGAPSSEGASGSLARGGGSRGAGAMVPTKTRMHLIVCRGFLSCDLIGYETVNIQAITKPSDQFYI